MGEDIIEIGMMLGFFLIIGAGIGMISGVVGAGGGAALAPALYFAFVALDYDAGSRAHAAVGTSAAVITIVSLIGIKYRWALGTLDVALLRRSTPWLALGGLVGAGAALLAPDGVLLAYLGVAVFAAALVILFGEGPPSRRSRGASPAVGLGLPAGGYAGACVGLGAATAAAGLGGGAFVGPFYRADGASSAASIATATGAGLAVAGPAAVLFLALGSVRASGQPPFSLGDVNLAATAVIAPMILVAAPLGARLGPPVGLRIVRLLFAFLLAMVALSMARRAGLG